MDVAAVRRKPDPLKHCDQCGERMERKRYNNRLEDLAMFARRVYCGRGCMAAAFAGEPRTLTPAARTLRDRARKLKGLGPCEECGRLVEVDVHHRDGNLEHNELQNLERLCRPCHLGRHRGEGGQWGAPSLDVAAVTVRGRDGGATIEEANVGDVSPSLRGSGGGGTRQMIRVSPPEVDRERQPGETVDEWVERTRAEAGARALSGAASGYRVSHGAAQETGDVAPTLTGEGGAGANRHGAGWSGTDLTVVSVAENQRAEIREADVVPSMSSGGGKPGQGRPVVAITQPEVADVAPTLGKNDGARSGQFMSDGSGVVPVTGSARDGFEESDVADTLLTNGSFTPSRNAGGTLVLDTYNQDEVEGDVTNTLARSPMTAIAPGEQPAPEQPTGKLPDGRPEMNPPPDGRRYAACGDGVAAPQAHWIGLRLLAVMKGRDPDA